MRARLRGFTLIELVVTLAVAAILLTLAAPSMADLLRANRLASANNGLVTALNVARAEALRRGASVTVCPSANQRSCVGSTDWATGWVVFEDTATTGNPASPPASGAGSERLISSTPAVGDQFVLTAQDTWYRYAPTGSLSWSTAATAAERTFTLRNTLCRGNGVREITVNRIGRIRSAAKACP